MDSTIAVRTGSISTVPIIQHSFSSAVPFITSSVKTKLTIKHLGQELNLRHEVIFSRTIQLSNFLGSVGIGNTVLTTLKLELNVCATLFSLLVYELPI
jgi:hypothetical protein